MEKRINESRKQQYLIIIFIIVIFSCSLTMGNDNSNFIFGFNIGRGLVNWYSTGIVFLPGYDKANIYKFILGYEYKFLSLTCDIGYMDTKSDWSPLKDMEVYPIGLDIMLKSKNNFYIGLGLDYYNIYLSTTKKRYLVDIITNYETDPYEIININEHLTSVGLGLLLGGEIKIYKQLFFDFNINWTMECIDRSSNDPIYTFQLGGLLFNIGMKYKL